MSGHKKATVSISQKEYQRLHEAEIKLRFLKQSNKKKKEEIKNDSVNALWNNFDEIESRQNEFSDLINSFGAEIQNIESGTCDAIMDHQRDLSNQLDEYAGDLWKKTNELLREQNIRFENEIKKQHLQQLHHTHLLEEQIEAYRMDQRRKFEIAVEWLNNTKEISKFIYQNYDHEKFFPSQLNQLISRIKIAQSNLENGIPESAISISQNTYFDLSNLRIALENKQNEWFILHQSILEEIQGLAQTANENNFLPGTDLNGDPMDQTIDIDFWSGRKLSRFKGYINSLLNNLTHQSRDISTEFLIELQENELQKFHKDLEKIIYTARLNALNSQLRINIADLVIQALEEQGFALSDSNYKKEDMRKEFTAHLQNIEGNQVEIQVTPSPSQICENHLLIHSYDENIRTKHELHQRSMEITNSLQKYGLNVGAVREISGADQTSRNPVRSRSIQGRYQPSIKKDHYEQARY